MISGIHHITAIASDAKKTVAFYTQILGLRLVKKTVNQDDVGTYHLFFGDKLGHPGMDLTFFIFLPSVPGRRGNGLVTTISFAVPEASLDFWKQRFELYTVKHEDVREWFGKKRLNFYDSDDRRLALVGVREDELEKDADLWTTNDVSEANAIRSFYSATLSVLSLGMIEPILTQAFGYVQVREDENYRLYALANEYRAHMLEVEEVPSPEEGINTAGTVHHIAFRVKDQEEQHAVRQTVVSLGLSATEMINRFYFQSVYFRTPAGILFEIATDGPGFTADEDEKDLGKKLALPPFLEPNRKEIESQLIPLETS
jgi:glyoxalase family protein